MKPSLPIKILILLGYVVLCTTLLVLGDQQAEPSAYGEQGLTDASYE
jgi:hypothetical protein